MSESAKPNPYTTNEILLRFKNYVKTRKPGLKRFYYNEDGSDNFSDCAKRGSDMTKKLVGIGCPVEVAAELSLLVLWDLVVLIGTNRLHMFVLVLYTCCLLLHSHWPQLLLYNSSTDARDIDNSISMGISENGARVETLAKTLGAISEVYSFARIEGIKAITFLNTRAIHENVTPEMITTPIMSDIVFEGLTNIGTKLRDKVLVKYVTPDMKKPLLVIVLTDAEVRRPRTINSDSSLLTQTRSRARLQVYSEM